MKAIFMCHRSSKNTNFFVTTWVVLAQSKPKPILVGAPDPTWGAYTTISATPPSRLGRGAHHLHIPPP